jgi:hypothetical protein
MLCGGPAGFETGSCDCFPIRVYAVFSLRPVFQIRHCYDIWVVIRVEEILSQFLSSTPTCWALDRQVSEPRWARFLVSSITVSMIFGEYFSVLAYCWVKAHTFRGPISPTVAVMKQPPLITPQCILSSISSRHVLSPLC